MPTAKHRIAPRVPRPGAFTFDKEVVEAFLVAFGDDNHPLPETVKVLDEIVTDYIIESCHEAASVAHHARRAKIKLDDFKFMLRRDTTKLGRVSEMLERDKDLKKQRRAFDTEEGTVAKEHEKGGGEELAADKSGKSVAGVAKSDAGSGSKRERGEEGDRKDKKKRKKNRDAGAGGARDDASTYNSPREDERAEQRRPTPPSTDWPAGTDTQSHFSSTHSPPPPYSAGSNTSTPDAVPSQSQHSKSTHHDSSPSIPPTNDPHPQPEETRSYHCTSAELGPLLSKLLRPGQQIEIPVETPIQHGCTNDPPQGAREYNCTSAELGPLLSDIFKEAQSQGCTQYVYLRKEKECAAIKISIRPDDDGWKGGNRIREAGYKEL